MAIIYLIIQYDSVCESTGLIRCLWVALCLLGQRFKRLVAASLLLLSEAPKRDTWILNLTGWLTKKYSFSYHRYDCSSSQDRRPWCFAWSIEPFTYAFQCHARPCTYLWVHCLGNRSSLTP